MSSKSRERKLYVKQYPAKTNKWLNECLACGSIGYKPEMPEKIHPGLLAENLRSLFTLLAVNEISLCENCSINWELSNQNNIVH